MIFKTTQYYKNKINDLAIENLRLSMELNVIKNENERLKSEKTIQHERVQIDAETGSYNSEKYLYFNLKCKVLSEIDRNFEHYVKVSPIIEIPRECKCKQYATILIERKNQ